jgi:hypothetical protein
MALLQLSREKQWTMIGIGYALVTGFAAMLLYARHLQMSQDPVTASSGMAAAGDAILVLLISLMYLVPSTFLLRMMADHERVYCAYARVLLALSLTAPLALALLVANSKLKTDWFQGLALTRLFSVPMILIVIGVSRWMARSSRSKEIVNYAGLTETLTLLLIVIVWMRA